MPWCPKCKYEYREGIEKCSDCKIPLVSYYPMGEYHEEEESEYITDENLLMEYAEELSQDEQKIQTKGSSNRAYQAKKTKAEDFKSSGYILIAVGLIGLVAIVLMELHVFPIYLAAPGKYISYSVMGGLFLIFIVSGIHSLVSAKKYAAEAKSEDDLTEKIKAWTKENISKETIIEKANLSDKMPEEMKYFKYMAILKSMITEEFGELDASFLDSLSEEFYSDLFDE